MLKVKPVTKYNTPDYPTKASASGGMLKKLPSRWKKNKNVLVCMGMMGAIALTSCTANTTPMTSDSRSNDSRPSFFSRFRSSPTSTAPNEVHVDNFFDFADHGGAGGLADYVLTFTEQEMLDIIKAEAAAFGINLTETENIRSFEVSLKHGNANVSILLSDEELGIEIAYLHDWVELLSRPWEILPLSDVSDIILDDLIIKSDDVVLGVFINLAGHGFVFGPDWDRGLAEDRLEEIKENLVLQVHDFIEWLKQEGILEI